jgi:ATP/maltotriose-dependent transcriptional regulator MalT
MLAGRQQSRAVVPRRRIIERPRLIALLDRMEAATILLVAPAGYGKTTLARQWARTLTGTIWIGSTSSHRDVVTFSEDVADGVDALGGNAAKFIGEFMRARSNPQRAAREIAGALAARVEEAHVQWLVIDDYHELAEAPEVEEMVAVLRERVSARFLVAARARPHWATARGALYGQLGEIGAEELAMTPDEIEELLGRRPDLEALIRRAQGWPAVLALAAGLDSAGPREDPVPGMLHQYVAEELFQSASLELREALIALALLPDLGAGTIARRFGDDAETLVEQAQELGFVGGDDELDLHPLLREFLLAKLAEESDADARVREAVAASLDAEAWDGALDLVLRFDLADLVDPVLQRAFKPLVRSGRLGTLSSFASRVRQSPAFPLPAVDVVEAEVALRDGQFDLAIELARRVQPHLADDHPLKSRSNAVLGQSEFFVAEFGEAQAAFKLARQTALDDADVGEAQYGLACAKVLGEEDDASEAVADVVRDRHRSPHHLLRFAVAELSRRRFDEGLRDPLPIHEPLHALQQVEDPRARTSFTYTVANALAQRAEYKRAEEFLALLAKDVKAFGLEFAAPYLHWTSALISLGLRRFGDVDHSLRTIEELVEQRQHPSHAFNARILRARMLLQTGEAEEALAQIQVPATLPVVPSWRAEHLATEALVLACLGLPERSKKAAAAADSTTRCIEVRVLASAARAVSGAKAGATGPGVSLIEEAERFAIWDPVLCAVRSSLELAEMLAATEATRPSLRRLYEQTEDHARARRAGLRTRSNRRVTELLSPRELEVLGLVAQGLRNREIAAALFIAESTAKVHVRHVLEKLNVRTRAEAVAQYARLRETRED